MHAKNRIAASNLLYLANLVYIWSQKLRMRINRMVITAKAKMENSDKNMVHGLVKFNKTRSHRKIGMENTIQ